MKIFVTGGAGYIGTMLSTKLLEQGHHVTVVDLLKYDKGSLNHLYFHKNFNFICEDVRNKNLIEPTKETLKSKNTPLDNLSFVVLDLLKDEGWDEAAKGCRYTMHVASPFPIKVSNDRMESILRFSPIKICGSNNGKTGTQHSQ